MNEDRTPYLEIDIFGAIRAGWLWLLIGSMAMALLAATYAFAATPWYRAEVQVAPAEQKSMSPNLGSLGGLASLAGISIGSADTAEPIAVLRSREFAADFIEANSLLPVLFHDQWNSSKGEWKVRDQSQQPDVRDGVSYLHDRVLTVSEDKKSGMISIGMQWTDPQLAASWANQIVDRLNSRMRSQALKDSARNIAFLKEEMASTSIAPMQQSIGRVLESEMQKLLLARGNEQFSFKVIDVAVAPKKAYKPKRVVLVGGALVLGLSVSLFLLLFRQALRARSARK